MTTTLNAFDSIKETLSVADVVAYYGVEVRRGNKALCPLHNEKTPSFAIYRDSNSWHCFGCGVGGSVIDFVMAYCGLDALESAKRLDMDFNLGFFDYKPTQEEMHRQKEQQAQKQADKGLAGAFESYINKAYDLLCDYLHLLHDWKVTHAPKAIDKPTFNPLFVEACHQLDYTEYLLDCLQNADIDEQISFYETHREELLNIANRIREYTGTPRASADQGLHPNSPKTDKSA